MDRYQKFATSGLGRQLVRRLGLPNPYPLRRDAALATPVLVGGASRLSFLKQLETGAAPYGALVFDASEISAVADLRQLHDFFHSAITQLGPCGRVIVIGRSPDSVAQRALEGFVRSVGKELRRGGTANLVHVADGAEDGVESTLRFLLSGRSAYVSGQVVHVSGNSPARHAGRQGRAGHGCLPGHRRGDRHGSGTRWRARGLPRRACGRRRAVEGRERRRRVGVAARHHRRSRAADLVPAGTARRRRRRRAQRGHHPRQDVGAHGLLAVGLGAGGQPRLPGTDQRGAAGRRRAARRRADRRGVVDQPASRATSARPTTPRRRPV